MRKIYVYVIGLFLAVFILVPSSFASTIKNVNVDSAGVIQYSSPEPDPDAFIMHGADVDLSCFFDNNPDYQPNIWQMLKDLNINFIRCFPGVQGDVADFNLVYDSDWAQNLDSFLTQANSNGIKVAFYAMGSPNYGDLLLGIQPSMSLSTAMNMVDQLAGSNALGHNFITDSRIAYWSTSNEQTMDQSAIDWNIGLCDYIRSLGGKAHVSMPLVNGWTTDPELVGQIFAGHVDMVEYHEYGEYDYVRHFGRSLTQTWNGQTFYEWMRDLFQRMVDTPGFSSDQVFLGEYGCWIGYGTNEGLSEGITFTDQDRINIYSTIFSAAEEVGLKNFAFHFVVAGQGESPDYGVYKPDHSGQYWDNNLASIIRAAYA